MSVKQFGRILLSSSTGVKFGGGKLTGLYSLTKYMNEFFFNNYRELYKKNILAMRGSFRPVTKVNIDMLEKGLEKFAVKHKKNTENFIELEPLIFIGNTTLHTNHPVSLSCSSYRLTLLAHFFDPSPKYGVGSLLRSLRNR